MRSYYLVCPYCGFDFTANLDEEEFEQKKESICECPCGWTMVVANMTIYKNGENK